jgi:dimethylargininase
MLPPFRYALLRQPAPTFAAGITSHPELGIPDSVLTQRQYAGYVDALRRCGLDLAILPADARFPDGHYVEDTAVIFRDMAFISLTGAATRQGEEIAIAEQLGHLNLIHIQGEEARLDGGDVLFCHDRVLVGLSERTNRAGAEQLQAALRTVQADLRVEFVPFEGVLHLKTGVTELAPEVLLHDPAMKTDYPFAFAEVITLPAEEGYAANVLPINGTLLIAEGYPTVLELAAQHYHEVISLPMSEFRKMDGGLTCLSLRY